MMCQYTPAGGREGGRRKERRKERAVTFGEMKKKKALFSLGENNNDVKSGVGETVRKIDSDKWKKRCN